MDRRSFLKAVRSACLVAATPAAIARQRFSPPPALTDFSPEGLRRAIEALFPAGVERIDVRMENGSQSAFGLAPTKGEGRLISYAPGWEPREFGMGTILSDEDAEDGAAAKQVRRLYLAMYATATGHAARPENQNAILLWRQTPTERRTKDLQTLETKVAVRMRFGLSQTGWRRRLSVLPRLAT